MSLENQVAIVTGAGRGIGLAIAQRLARDGAAVAAVDLRGYRAERLADGLTVDGGKAIAIEADVTTRDGAVDITTRTLDAFGRIDILVNNVGGPRVEPFLKKDADAWPDELALNLTSAIQCCHVVVPHLVKQGSGRVISIASDAARSGLWGHSIYAAGKGGIMAFTKVLAGEIAGKGVTVNCVSPGLTATPPVVNRMEAEPEWAEGLLKTIPAGRLGEPEEIAAAVAFLVSAEAAYITGQSLSVGGGIAV